MDNGRLRLSVVITCFNNSKYLEQCINSVISQTYKPFEIIVADDASTDDSCRILEGYARKHKRIRLILRKENAGVAKNRDQAVRKARGELITTLDGDDYYFSKNKLENEIKQFDGEKDHKRVVAYSNICIVNQQGKLLKRIYNDRNIITGENFFNIISRKVPVPRDFVVAKKTFEKAGGYDHIIPVYEDWDLKIRVSKHVKFKYSGVDGTAYRRTNTGLSSVNHMKRKKWLTYIIQKNISLCRGQGQRISCRLYLAQTLIKLYIRVALKMVLLRK